MSNEQIMRDAAAALRWCIDENIPLCGSGCPWWEDCLHDQRSLKLLEAVDAIETVLAENRILRARK